MARIKNLYLDDPFSGRRRMVGYLAREGIPSSRERVRNSFCCMGLLAIYQKPRTTIPGNPSERFPCLVDLNDFTDVDQVWARDLPTSRCPSCSFIWWRLLSSSPEMFSAGSFLIAWIRRSAWSRRRLTWRQAAGQVSFISSKVVNSPLPSTWPSCRQKASRSAGQEVSVAKKISWWNGCGVQLITRRCTCMPTDRAGM